MTLALNKQHNFSYFLLQALEKYKYEQSLEHTSQFIEKLEKELEDFQKHLAQFKKRKGRCLESMVNS